MNRCTADQFPLLHTPEGNVVQLKSLNHRHHAIMDWMLANPHRRLGECAQELGVTQAWLSTVINSDLFKARLALRREAIEDEQHRRLNARLLDIAEDGLEALHDHVRDGEIDPKTKQDITRMSLEAIGILGKRGAGTQVTINNNADPHAADASSLMAARARMQGEVVDGEIV